MIKVTIDFDQTLSKPEVQSFVASLLRRGDVDVYILTYRFDDLHYHFYKSKYDTVYEPNNNSDLYNVADDLDIPRNKIIFTNETPKYKYLNSCGHIKLHLDDCNRTLREINENSRTIAIDVKYWDYRKTFLDHLDKIRESNKQLC